MGSGRRAQDGHDVHLDDNCMCVLVEDDKAEDLAGSPAPALSFGGHEPSCTKLPVPDRGQPRRRCHDWCTLWYGDICDYRCWHDWPHAGACVCYPCVMRHWPMAQGHLPRQVDFDIACCFAGLLWYDASGEWGVPLTESKSVRLAVRALALGGRLDGK